MQHSDNTAGAILQADDLTILLDRLEGVDEMIAFGRMRQARNDLLLAAGLARAIVLAAQMAMESSESAGDKAHHEALGGLAKRVAHLLRNASLKLDQSRATSALADVGSAIELAQEMVEAAERFAEVAA